MIKWIEQPRNLRFLTLYLIVSFVTWFVLWTRRHGWSSSFTTLNAETPFVTLLTNLIFCMLVFFAIGFLFTRSLLHRTNSGIGNPSRSAERLHGRYVRVPESLGLLTRRFDDLLLTHEPGIDRDHLADVIVEEMAVLVRSNTIDPAPLTASESPGHRLAAIMMLQVEPDFNYLSWLAERLTSEKKLLGLEAAKALLSAARMGDNSQKDFILAAIKSALYGNGVVNLNHNDSRREILEKAVKELHDGT